MQGRTRWNPPPLFQEVMISGNRSCGAIGDSYQGIAHLVQLIRREMESVLSDAALSHSPFFIVPFGKLCSSIFHLLFLTFFTDKLRQSVRIAFEKQSECQLAEQTGRTKPQDSAISGTQSDVMLRRHLFHQPAISVIRMFRIESERGHSCASFLLIRSILHGLTL